MWVLGLCRHRLPPGRHSIHEGETDCAVSGALGMGHKMVIGFDWIKGVLRRFCWWWWHWLCISERWTRGAADKVSHNKRREKT